MNSVSSIVANAAETFNGDDFSWFKNDGQEEVDLNENSDSEELMESQTEDSNRILGCGKMKNLLDSWEQPVAKSYSAENVNESFLKFIKVHLGLKDPSLKDSFHEYVICFGQDPKCSEFIDMFQRLQIKSNSEAVCETIGSVMKLAKGKNRKCAPINFSKEVFLSYNLPPPHLLMKTFLAELVSDMITKKDFHRKGDTKSQSIVNRLKCSNLSASLNNFCKSEESK